MYIAVAEFLTQENIARAAAINGIAEEGEGFRVVQIYEYYLRQEWNGEEWISPLVPVPGRNRQGIPLYACSWLAGRDYVKPSED